MASAEGPGSFILGAPHFLFSAGAPEVPPAHWLGGSLREAWGCFFEESVCYRSRAHINMASSTSMSAIKDKSTGREMSGAAFGVQ